jgi:hypothetical protein
VRFTAEQLRSREDIFGHVRRRNQQRDQLDRFFNGQFQDWPLVRLHVQETAESGKLGWQDCIDRIRAHSPEIARDWLHARQAHERRPLLRTALKLGASSRAMGIAGADRSPQELGIELENIAAGRMTFHEPLMEGFALYAQRVDHAIRSMSAPERSQAMRLRGAIAALEALGADALRLVELAGAMHAFGSIAESSGEMPVGFDELESSFAECASELLARAERIPQTVTAGGTVGAYLRACCPGLPPAGASVARSVLARACWPLPESFHHIYTLAVGELVSLCEAAEKARGIRPIRLVA